MAEPFYLGGQQTTSPTVLPVIFPYTGEAFAEVYLAGQKDLFRAADIAALAFNETKNIPASRRAKILHRIADLIEENRDEFCYRIVHESGKPYTQANQEITRAVTIMRISAEETLRISGEIIPLERMETGSSYTSHYYRVPAGPVLCITPFNYPLVLVCHKLGPIIAAGCSFVLKPSSKTPLTALLLGRLILEAGYPADAVNIVPCIGSSAEILVRDTRFAALSFTGSPAVGWKLKELFPGRRIGLELGGNAPAIVYKDADIAYAAEQISKGAVINAGQSCISVQRVYLHTDIYDRCLSLILADMQKYTVGDPRDPKTDIGPMISEADAIHAEEKIKQALMRGARLLTGGIRNGAVLSPTVIERTSSEMSICNSEVFAPIIVIRSFSDIDDALKLANESRYGLQGSVFTNSLDILDKAALELDCGTIIINDYPSFRADEMPYGGLKLSGLGREGPKYLIDMFMERKQLVIKHHHQPVKR